MYKTRIVKVGEEYFIEFKWCGGWFKPIITPGSRFYWTRWCSNTAFPSLAQAKKGTVRALKSYELNKRWNEKVVE